MNNKFLLLTFKTGNCRIKKIAKLEGFGCTEGSVDDTDEGKRSFKFNSQNLKIIQQRVRTGVKVKVVSMQTWTDP
jgi:L-ribulose-5-phosphate 3-epimerase UlaE